MPTDFSESILPSELSALAAKAGREAHDLALQRLGKVVKLQDGQVVEASRDGSIKLLSGERRTTTRIQKGLILQRRK
jgi:hypothetical protein